MTTQQAESRTRETIPCLILRTQSTILHKTSSHHMNVMLRYGNDVVNRTGQLMYKAKGCYSMMLRWSDTFNELVRS